MHTSHARIRFMLFRWINRFSLNFFNRQVTSRSSIKQKALLTYLIINIHIWFSFPGTEMYFSIILLIHSLQLISQHPSIYIPLLGNSSYLNRLISSNLANTSSTIVQFTRLLRKCEEALHKVWLSLFRNNLICVQIED